MKIATTMRSIRNARPDLRWNALPQIVTVLAILPLTANIATAQIHDPETIFNRAEEREETPFDVHLPRNCVDPLFEPFKCFDRRMEECGGPIFLGLYAPIWQAGSQGGEHSQMISQSLNLYGEWELLHDPGNEGTLYAFYLHESESLNTTAGEFAGSIGTTILPNDDVGDAVNALAHLAWTQKFCDGRFELSAGQLAPENHDRPERLRRLGPDGVYCWAAGRQSSSQLPDRCCRR